jgi:hypothetical protein
MQIVDSLLEVVHVVPEAVDLSFQDLVLLLLPSTWGVAIGGFTGREGSDEWLELEFTIPRRLFLDNRKGPQGAFRIALRFKNEALSWFPGGETIVGRIKEERRRVAHRCNCAACQ